MQRPWSGDGLGQVPLPMKKPASFGIRAYIEGSYQPDITAWFGMLAQPGHAGTDAQASKEARVSAEVARDIQAELLHRLLFI